MRQEHTSAGYKKKTPNTPFKKVSFNFVKVYNTIFILFFSLILRSSHFWYFGWHQNYSFPPTTTDNCKIHWWQHLNLVFFSFVQAKYCCNSKILKFTYTHVFVLFLIESLYLYLSVHFLIIPNDLTIIGTEVILRHPIFFQFLFRGIYLFY